MGDKNDLFQLVVVFYTNAEKDCNIVKKIIETVHIHTLAVELAAELLENGILSPSVLLKKLENEKTALQNEDKTKIIKDGQSSEATYYNHIHTLFSLYHLSERQQDIMRNLCFFTA